MSHHRTGQQVGNPGGHPEGRRVGHPGGHPVGIGSVTPVNWVYSRAPMIVYWELTTACGLACRHCRATAMPDAAPGQLSTAECVRVLDDIATFGDPLPHLVLTGGDPLRRADLDLLIGEATDRGIGVSLAPAVTGDLTKERLAQLQAAGVQAISLSLDGSDPARHDGVRGVPGTFAQTMTALDWAAGLGLPVQVNTLVTDVTAADLPAMYEVLRGRTLMRWSLFFLISVGRGSTLTEMAPVDAERLMRWLFDIAGQAPFQVKTTEAMQYRRVAVRQMRHQGMTDAQIEASSVGRGFGIRDGNGIVFIAQDGTVNPSGFLPLPLGNVRESSIVELYRTHPDMLAMRDVTAFKGRCGRCSFAQWCGGSRARAYAWTGDPLESDPLCPYEPPAPRPGATRGREPERPAMTDVLIIGAGITGLAAAWELSGSGAEVVLLEAGPVAGGKVRSEARDGFLIEHGPDSVITYRPAALALIRELGLERPGDRRVRTPLGGPARGRADAPDALEHGHGAAHPARAVRAHPDPRLAGQGPSRSGRPAAPGDDRGRHVDRRAAAQTAR